MDYLLFIIKKPNVLYLKELNLKSFPRSNSFIGIAIVRSHQLCQCILLSTSPPKDKQLVRSYFHHLSATAFGFPHSSIVTTIYIGLNQHTLNIPLNDNEMCYFIKKDDFLFLIIVLLTLENNSTT